MSGSPTIVLTGGPGGGKTTLMRELRGADPRARRWLLVPEAAPLLFQAGLDSKQKSFQLAVVRLQITLECACMAVARPDQALICHRATLDPLAYWLREGWDESEFLDLTGITRDEHFARYDRILHLQSTAVGATDHYQRWPDAHRPETATQAASIDRLCSHAWSQHPGYVLIDNASRDWSAKSRLAVDLLRQYSRSRGSARSHNFYVCSRRMIGPPGVSHAVVDP